MYQTIKPLLFSLEPELAHDQSVRALRLAQTLPLVRRAIELLFHYEDPILATECAGMSFINPFGMAAGFDKRAELITGLAALGFGHVEVGTITPQPQPGNQRPRMFRLPEDDALINRMGFNSAGMEAVARNLDVGRRTADGSEATVHRPPSLVRLGINIGKNKLTDNERAAEDYLLAFDRLAALGNYVTVNISSPNTPGLRQLQARNALEQLLGALMARNRTLPAPLPLFVKVSPDETPAQLDDIVQAALGAGISGIIAGNTTLSRENLRGAARGEAGGLSGRPLTERARATIRYLYQATQGTMPIIGVGGVMNAEEAYGHIRAGATLVQVYTALVYHGPGLVKTLKRDLATLLRRDGVRSVAEAVGGG